MVATGGNRLVSLLWGAYKKTAAWSLGRQKIGTETTDENGVIVREDLTAGTYEVTELGAPEPYRTIEIQDMHDAVPITNQADGMLYILKLDGVTGGPWPGRGLKYRFFRRGIASFSFEDEIKSAQGNHPTPHMFRHNSKNELLKLLKKVLLSVIIGDGVAIAMCRSGMDSCKERGEGLIQCH